MNKENIIKVLNRTGRQKIRAFDQNVVTDCFFAPWDHHNGMDKHPSFSVKIDPVGTSIAYCWSCQAHGTLSDMVYAYSRLVPAYDFGPLIQWIDETDIPNVEHLIKKVEASILSGACPQQADDTLKTPTSAVYPESILAPYLGAVPRYVLDRGITLDTCRAWKLGYDKNERDPRLIFPVWDFESKLVGTVGRTLSGSSMKYRNCNGFKAERYLYGENFVDPLRKDLPIVLVEGMLDVLWLWQHKLAQPLGLFGSKMTEGRARKISYLFGSRMIFSMFDGDEAGDGARNSTQKLLCNLIPVLQLSLPRGSDPQSLPPEEISKILSFAS